jgi:Tfp pilus assembly protein PilN
MKNPLLFWLCFMFLAVSCLAGAISNHYQSQKIEQQSQDIEQLKRLVGLMEMQNDRMKRMEHNLNATIARDDVQSARLNSLNKRVTKLEGK